MFITSRYYKPHYLIKISLKSLLQFMKCSPISQLNSFPLEFDFFFYFLVIGNSCTEEFKLYNPLKHSLVLFVGYSYSAQFIAYFGGHHLEVATSFSWKTAERIKLVP